MLSKEDSGYARKLQLNRSQCFFPACSLQLKMNAGTKEKKDVTISAIQEPIRTVAPVLMATSSGRTKSNASL